MKLRPAQELYANIFQNNVLNANILNPNQMELPCNFGKTELIVNYNVPEVIKKNSGQKTIHFCVTIMASPYDTFVSRIPDFDLPYGEKVFYNKKDTELDYLLDNVSSVLSNYNHIIIFTTLDKMNTDKSKPLFDDLMTKGRDKGFKWCLDRDEGDYAGFDSVEQQAFESGASVESGASKYAINIMDMFNKFKSNCIYLLAVSGTTLNAHNSKVQLVREVANPIALIQDENINIDMHGIVTDKLTNHVSDQSSWTRLISEEVFYEMKHLNVEFNSWFAEPKLYHKRNYQDLIKHSIQWSKEKQQKINNEKSWLIKNISKFYPNVDKKDFSNIFDNHQKINLIQSGKDGEYQTKSFIMPSELIKDLKKYDDIKSIFVHSNPDIQGTIQSIDKEEIKDQKIDTIGVCNLLSRGYDIPHINSIAILATSPKMDKKSISAPYTKRHIQTGGRGARHGSGLKNCGGLTDAKNLLFKLGIDINEDNEFNHKFREFILENLEVQIWLLYEDGVDTATYIAEKLKRYYITFVEMKNAVDITLGNKTDELCPTCNRPWPDGNSKIEKITSDDIQCIDEALTKPSLWSKIKNFCS